MRIKLTNTFHGTIMITKVESYLESFAKVGEYMEMLSYYAQDPVVSNDKIKLTRIHNVLCGSKTCQCGSMIKSEII